MENKKKAIFFDRDGTLIHNAHYLDDLSKIVLIHHTLDFARWGIAQGYLIFVVTNQSGIARGYFDEQFVEKIHRHLDILFADYGVKVTQWYFCPHHPTNAVNERYKKICECRKPRPGMLYAAAQEFNIDLTHSLMIGDSVSDLEAGRAAGCRTIHVDELNKDYKERAWITNKADYK